jgi:hypothetical protein
VSPLTADSTLDEVDAEVTVALKTFLESYSAHLPVRRVTVVGNAPLEPSEARRDVIDSSDLVFRCNSFVLDEPDGPPCLGTKTDVVVAALVTRITPWFFRDYRNRAYLQVDVGNTRRPLPPLPFSWPDDLGYWPIPNRTLGIPIRLALHPESQGVKAVPTTGTQAAYVAHELFPEAELVLTGFSYLHDREQTAWQHHWGDSAPVHVAHLLDREGAMLESWITDGSAVFVP